MARAGLRAPGLPRLLEVVQQLEGQELPWSMLRDHVLPARVAGFTLDMLDMLRPPARSFGSAAVR